MLFINGIKDERRGCQEHRILDVLEALEENGREPMIFSILTKNYSRNLGCHVYKPWSHYLKDIERIRQYREERRQKEEAESLAEEERKRLEQKRQQEAIKREEETERTIGLISSDSESNRIAKIIRALYELEPRHQAVLVYALAYCADDTRRGALNRFEGCLFGMAGAGRLIGQTGGNKIVTIDFKRRGPCSDGNDS